tara:strand:- start:12 stop:311 length:300 start_codon:yes stop_codon:yes gene_type:complete
MTDLKMFVGILKMTEETAQNLGLQSLTPMDRFILTAMWEKYERHERGFPVVFDDFSKDCSQRGINISKAQLYKSIKRFISAGIIEKLGGQRSGLYTFVE